MGNKAEKTLEMVFKSPTPSNIRWSDIETLILSLHGTVQEGSGSRVRCTLNGVRAVFHRPHPRPYTDKGAVNAVRRFLVNAGVRP